MSDFGSANWSETDASNNAATPNGWPEGMNPSDVNNCARANMGAEKRFWNRINAVKTTAGTSTAYTLTYDVAAASYYDGELFAFVFDQACGAAPTLNINALGARNIRKYTSGAWANLAASDVTANQAVIARYNLSATTFDIVAMALNAADFVKLAIANTFTAAQTFSATAAMSAAAFNEASASIASAATVNIGAAAANYLTVTGTTTITAFDTVQAGTERTLEFAGSLTLTHNATSLILLGAANIVTTAGDVATFRSEGSGNWRCTNYSPVNGHIAGLATPVVARYTTNADLTTAIPFDNTIPQVTEGSQIFSQAFTAKNAANRVRIRVEGFGSTTTGSDYMTMALYMDGAANAVKAVGQMTTTASNPAILSLTYEAAVAAGAHTWTVRVGANSTTMRMNGNVTSAIYGGVAETIMTIEEIPAP